MEKAQPTISDFHRFRRRYFTYNNNFTSKTKKKLAVLLILATASVILFISSYSFAFLSPPTHSQPPFLVDDHDTTALTIRPPAASKRTATIVHKTTTTTRGRVETDHNLFGTKCANPLPSELVFPTILDRVFNGTSPWENFPPDHIRGLLKPKRIKGWGSKGAVFENLIRKVQPMTVIEVGTFLGASALHMAELTREVGLRRTQILCIDDFRGWPGFRENFKDIKMVNGDVMLMYQFMQNVVEVNETGRVIFMPFSSGSALDKLCEWGVSGDLIEVDAGHDFHSAWADINRAYKILRRGGIIFGHDYFTSADNKGVRRAVNLFARINGLQVQVDGQHWVIQSPPFQN